MCDFVSTLSACQTKKLWKPKNGGIWWDFQNVLKMNIGSKVAKICALEVWKHQKTVKLIFFENARKRVKNLNSKIFTEIKSHYIYPLRFPEVFLESDSVKEFWEIWEIYFFISKNYKKKKKLLYYTFLICVMLNVWLAFDFSTNSLEAITFIKNSGNFTYLSLLL